MTLSPVLNVADGLQLGSACTDSHALHLSGVAPVRVESGDAHRRPSRRITRWSMASCSACEHLIDRIRHGVVDAAAGTPTGAPCIVRVICGRSEFAGTGHDGAGAVGDKLTARIC
jgi:hypothetical protein